MGTVIRLAHAGDAEQLERLNAEFNGPGNASLAGIHESLMRNRQEFVVAAEDAGRLVGFVCVQLKRSFCYEDDMPEITEVYVVPENRGKGIAGKMLAFAEAHVRNTVPFHAIELLTGKTNAAAQSAYRKLLYKEDGETHMVKRMEP